MEPSITVYVLKSEAHDRFYVGMSKDVANRLKEHNSGKTKSTKGYRPWKLFHREEYPNREEARNREKFLKSGRGRAYIRKQWDEAQKA